MIFTINILKVSMITKNELLFTDIDSLMYETETENVYKDIYKEKELFDFINYPKESNYYANTNNSVDKMKHKTGGVPVKAL